MRTPVLLLFLALAAMAQEEAPRIFDLNEAILKGDLVAVEAMIRDGVDVNGKDDEGRTPLVLAVHHRRREIVATLLDAEADPTQGGYSGMEPMTPIAAAASSGDLRTLRLIVGAVRNPSLVRAALATAAQSGNLDAVRMLLESGADAAGAGRHGRPRRVRAQSRNVWGRRRSHEREGQERPSLRL